MTDRQTRRALTGAHKVADGTGTEVVEDAIAAREKSHLEKTGSPNQKVESKLVKISRKRDLPDFLRHARVDAVARISQFGDLARE